MRSACKHAPVFQQYLLKRVRVPSARQRVRIGYTHGSAYGAAQALVFESFEGIESCLAAIDADPDAVIVRIKNRYTHSYEADETAGYR